MLSSPSRLETDCLYWLRSFPMIKTKLFWIATICRPTWHERIIKQTWAFGWFLPWILYLIRSKLQSCLLIVARCISLSNRCRNRFKWSSRTYFVNERCHLFSWSWQCDSLWNRKRFHNYFWNRLRFRRRLIFLFVQPVLPVLSQGTRYTRLLRRCIWSYVLASFTQTYPKVSTSFCMSMSFFNNDWSISQRKLVISKF